MSSTKRLLERDAAAQLQDAPIYATLDIIAAAREESDSGDMEAMAERAEAEARLRRALSQQAYARASY